jgi:DNA repair exonuclease SbcCD ATPase subunit
MAPRNLRISNEALEQRVYGLEQGISNLDKRIDSDFASLRSDFANAINGINSKLDRAGDIRWIWGPLVGGAMLLLAVVGGLGTLSLNPVKENVASLEARHLRSEREGLERDVRTIELLLKTKERLDVMYGQLHPLQRP